MISKLILESLFVGRRLQGSGFTGFLGTALFCMSELRRFYPEKVILDYLGLYSRSWVSIFVKVEVTSSGWAYEDRALQLWSQNGKWKEIGRHFCAKKRDKGSFLLVCSEIDFILQTKSGLNFLYFFEKAA